MSFSSVWSTILIETLSELETFYSLEHSVLWKVLVVKETTFIQLNLVFMNRRKKIFIRCDMCCCHCFSLVEWTLKQAACTSRINSIPSVGSPFVFVFVSAFCCSASIQFNSIQLQYIYIVLLTIDIVTKQQCRNLDGDVLYILIPYKQTRGDRGEEKPF